MADPLSITVSVLAIITAAIQATTSLKDAVNRSKGRDKTLARLEAELKDLSGILTLLKEVVDMESSTMALLEGPVSRCSQVCREFQVSMEEFTSKSKVSILDWAKMEFMRGDINEFMDTLAGYKATISVGIGTITMHASKVSQKVIEDYNEMIKDTVHDLNVHLQRIDDKMARFTTESAQNGDASGASVDLEDERAVTEQCLRICEDARSFIESRIEAEESLRQQSPPAAAAETRSQFEAQVLTRRALDGNREVFSETIGRLRERLESLSRDGVPENDAERRRLQEEIETSRQCLEVCRVASDQLAHKKIFTVGEMVADGDSDQVVVTTLADLFDVKKATSTNKSAQWIGSVSEDTAQKISSDRYGSRFGAVVGGETRFISRPSASEARRANNGTAYRPGTDGQSPNSEPVRKRPSPNEMRKRATEDDSGK
ncbi:hypothetical protein EsH8_III_000048 [Colletotrichum jinshuiense]